MTRGLAEKDGQRIVAARQTLCLHPRSLTSRLGAARGPGPAGRGRCVPLLGVGPPRSVVGHQSAPQRHPTLVQRGRPARTRIQIGNRRAHHITTSPLRTDFNFHSIGGPNLEIRNWQKPFMGSSPTTIFATPFGLTDLHCPRSFPIFGMVSIALFRNRRSGPIFWRQNSLRL